MSSSIPDINEHNWALFMLFGLVGGLGIFLFGMSISSDGVKKAAGSKMKTALRSLTHSRLLGVFVGLVLTLFTQSSSATTVFLIGFVSAELMTLAQTFGVILGADIGTTISVQMIAFKLIDYALLIVGVGYLVYSFSKKYLARYIGKTILGFGLVFLGIKIMSDSAAPLKDYQPFLDLLVDFQNPLFGVLVSALFTALIQASSATIALVISFANQGLVSLEQAIPIVLGANVGTCVTALMASIGAPPEAKRVAAVHILVKGLGVLLFIWWVSGFADFVRWVPFHRSSVGHQVANAHTIFNIAITVIFFPWATVIMRFAERIVPAKGAPQNRIFSVKYIEDKYLAVPVVALAQTSRELVRMGEITDEMLKEIGGLYENGMITQLEGIRAKEKMVDFLRKAIARYVTRLWQQELTPEQSEQTTVYMSVVNELEHIGDVIERDLCPLLLKKYERAMSFSKDGLKEIQDYHAKVLANYEMALLSLATSNRELAMQVLRNKAEIAKYERVYRQTHFARLMHDVKQSIETGAIHMDIIDNLKRINTYSANIAKALLGDVYPRDGAVFAVKKTEE